MAKPETQEAKIARLEQELAVVRQHNQLLLQEIQGFVGHVNLIGAAVPNIRVQGPAPEPESEEQAAETLPTSVNRAVRRRLAKARKNSPTPEAVEA